MAGSKVINAISSEARGLVTYSCPSNHTNNVAMVSCFTNALHSAGSNSCTVIIVKTSVIVEGLLAASATSAAVLAFRRYWQQVQHLGLAGSCPCALGSGIARGDPSSSGYLKAMHAMADALQVSVGYIWSEVKCQSYRYALNYLIPELLTCFVMAADRYPWSYMCGGQWNDGAGAY